MNAVIGVLVLLITDLFFTWAYYQYRRPQPSRWTTWELPAQAVCLGLVGGISFGFALVGQYLLSLGKEIINLFEFGVVITIVVAAVAMHLSLKSWLRRNVLGTRTSHASFRIQKTSRAPTTESDFEPETFPHRHDLAATRQRSRKKAA